MQYIILGHGPVVILRLKPLRLLNVAFKNVKEVMMQGATNKFTAQ